MNGHAHVEDLKIANALEANHTKLIELVGGLTLTQSRSTSPDTPSIQNQRSPKSNVYDTLLSTASRHPPSRSSTPRDHPLNPLHNKMPSSTRPLEGSSSSQQRPSSSHRQQEQGLRTRQIYTTPPVPVQQQQPFHVAASPSESSHQTPPSISSTEPLYARTQTQQQHPSGFVGPYTMSAPPGSNAFASQHQHQQPYAYPPMHHPGLHLHAHSTPKFYAVSHSQSPVYAPAPFIPSPIHARVMPEQAPSHGQEYEFEGPGRSPTLGSPYTPQPFPAFNFHPTFTVAPRFPYPHSSFAAPFQPHQQRPYQHSYAYLQIPSSPENATVQGPVSWWIVPPPSASSAVGPYQGVYYVDAYGNPSRAGLGLGQGFSPPSLHSTPHGPAQIVAFSSQESGIVSALEMGVGPSSSTEARSGIESGTSPESRISAGSSRPDSRASSSRGPLSPTLRSPGAPANERGKQPKHGNQIQRRSYHPNPPPQRSEWVMWVGNVPNDATHDELWRFFTQQYTPTIAAAPARQTQSALLPSGLLSPTESSPASDVSSATNSNVVSSVFLIARSNCAFVNYRLESHLRAAVARFNGVPLRPSDARCPRLVCRVRGQDEDLRAGVGGQRGMGMHVKWIKDQKAREREDEKERRKDGDRKKAKEQEVRGKEKEAREPPTPSSSLTDNTGSLPSQADSSLEYEHPPPHHSSSSGSTTSSFLTRYFPKRYFILKSLTQYDLELSVQRGLWATQPHNEGILNQAYRSSKEVFLIFGVNKSGEFYGYARMTGPVEKTEERVSWASRGDAQYSHSPATSFSSAVGRSSQINETIPEVREISDSPESEGDTIERPRPNFFPSEDRLAESSPMPITPREQRGLDVLRNNVPKRLQSSDSSHPDDGLLTSHINSSSSVRPPVRPPTPTHDRASAPAKLGFMHQRITDPRVEDVPARAGSVGAHMLVPSAPMMEPSRDVRLDAAREQQERGTSDQNAIEDVDHVKRKDTIVIPVSTSDRILPSVGAAHTLHCVPLLSVRENSPGPEDASVRAHQADVAMTESAVDGDVPTQWGTPFKVQWLRVGKLPFHNTRHLRNPWNHDREVKVSRDGTELEPGVGQLLLNGWDKEEPQRTFLPQAGISDVAESPSPSMGRRGERSRRAQSHTRAAAVGEAGVDQAPRRNRT